MPRGRHGGPTLAAYLFLLPYLTLFVVFMLLPALAGLAISFSNWDILGTPTWAGAANYATILADPLFRKSMWNTLYFMLLTAPPLVVVGLALALLLNQRLRGTSLVRTIVFMPYVVTVSTVGILWTWIYDKLAGLLNHYLGLIGVGPVPWLTDTHWSMPALALATVWWSVNVNMIIYLAALQDIPQELHEAARIDGAGVWARLRFITLPLLLPVTALVVSLTIVSCWRVFGQAYVMTQGGPEASTYVLAQYIYLTAFQNFEMGPAAAAGIALLLVTLGLSMLQIWAMRRR